MVTTNMLEPLDGADFSVSAVRKARSSGKSIYYNNNTTNVNTTNNNTNKYFGGGLELSCQTAKFSSAQGSLTPTESAIFEDCRATLNALTVILEQDCKMGIKIL